MELYELRRLYDYYLNTHTHVQPLTLRNGLCVCECGGMSIIKYEHICCSLFFSAFHWQKINKNNARKAGWHFVYHIYPKKRQERATAAYSL